MEENIDNRRCIDNMRLRIVEVGLYLQQHHDDLLPNADELIEQGCFDISVVIEPFFAKIETSRTILVPRIDRKTISLYSD